MTRVIGDVIGRSSIESWLAESPTITAALEHANARVVLVEAPSRTGALDAFFDGLQHVFDTMLDTLDTSFTPVFVASAHLYDLRALGLWGTDTPRPRAAPAPARGMFAGYFAIGEGGAVFVAAGPDWRERPEAIVARLVNEHA